MSETSPDHTSGGPPAAHDDVTLTLRRAEALVAFDLIARLVEEPEGEALRESFEHPAEIASLWALVAAFEQVLDEPLADDYRALLEQARENVVAHMTETD